MLRVLCGWLADRLQSGGRLQRHRYWKALLEEVELYSVAIVLKGPTARRGGNFEVPKTVLLHVAREPKLGFATNSPGRVVGGGGKDTLASVRSRPYNH